MANYSYKDPGEAIPDGSTIEGGNFTQLEPGTEIMVGKALTINGGNFTNVAVQPEWTINGGNWTQVSRCTNLHPELIGRGLTACPEACEHVVDTDEIYVDDVLVDIVCHYEDTRV